MISLAEAVKLKSILQSKYRELHTERMRVAYILVEKGVEAKREGRTLEVVEDEIAKIQKDIRTLDRLVYEANVKNFISFNDEELTLVEAIELAKQLRVEVNEIKEFASSEKEELQYGYGESVLMVRVALFDPEHYRLKSEQLERQAHKLSNLINAKNYEVRIPFDDSNYM